LINYFDITPEQWGVLSRLWQSEGIHESKLAARTAKDRHNNPNFEFVGKKKKK
jgi:DNA-binding MarR family transcriptional regulator